MKFYSLKCNIMVHCGIDDMTSGSVQVASVCSEWKKDYFKKILANTQTLHQNIVIAHVLVSRSCHHYKLNKAVGSWQKQIEKKKQPYRLSEDLIWTWLACSRSSVIFPAANVCGDNIWDCCLLVCPCLHMCDRGRRHFLCTPTGPSRSVEGKIWCLKTITVLLVSTHGSIAWRQKVTFLRHNDSGGWTADAQPEGAGHSRCFVPMLGSSFDSCHCIWPWQR